MTQVPMWRRYLRFWGPNAPADVDTELQVHLELLTEKYLAEGLTPADAQARALHRFGDMKRVRTECLKGDQRWETQKRRRVTLGALRQDLRYAVRMLAKNPGFTTVVVLSLALGIGATSTIFTVLNVAVLRPLPFQEPDRLVHMGWATPSTFLAWREQNHTFEQMSMGTVGGVGYGAGYAQQVSGAGRTERFRTQFVGAHLFRLLGVQPVLGRTFVAEDFRESWRGSVVVISFGFWQQWFGGDPAALGQELTLREEGTKTIVGVMPPGFWVNPQGSMVQVWMPSDDTAYDEKSIERTRRYVDAVGRLKGGVSIEQAQADLRTISRRIGLDTTPDGTPLRVQVEPLAERLSVGYAGTLYVLFGVVGCVLLIACLNVATLSLGRAAARRTEITTRLALGAGRWRVVRQLLTESVLLALLGGVLGVGLAFAGIKLFIALAAGWYAPTDEIRIDGTVLGFTVALSFLTGIVSGVAPALRSSAVNLADALKSGAQGALGRSRHRVGDVLVVAEAALALVLLVGAGLMLNSFVRVVRIDPGYPSDQLLTVHFSLFDRFDDPKYMEAEAPQALIRFTSGARVLQQQLLERIEALPEVESVGLGSSGGVPARVSVFGRPAAPRGEPFQARYLEIGPGYVRTLQIPLVQGRVFTARDGAGAPAVAIINETLARQLFPGEDPLGARLQVDDGQPRTIVGVVGDIKSWNLKSGTRPVMYVPDGQHLDGFERQAGYGVQRKLLVIRTAADPLSLVGAVRTAIADEDPDLVPFDVMTMDARIANSDQEEFWMLLLGLFAGLAVGLAAMGLYGVISYAVAQRTHELGVRTALGATRNDVLTMIVRQGLVLVLLGVAIGLPAAVGLTRVISSQLFGVTPTDPATFAAASVLFVGIALLACSIPARRATKVDPLVALRAE